MSNCYINVVINSNLNYIILVIESIAEIDGIDFLDDGGDSRLKKIMNNAVSLFVCGASCS